VSLQHEGGMARVPGRAVLCLLSAAVIKVDAFFSKASIHWWELQQVRQKIQKICICSA
jgi:hypothetical protein